MPADLQLLVKPVSADCNQACRYCFYRRVGGLYPERPSHRMSAATLDGLIRRFLRRRQTQSVFCWQGGEPTLAGLDFYRAAVQGMERHGRGGQSVSNALQTNGLLLDAEWCRFLAQYRFLVGVSLDGPAELHDAYRTSPGRQGSYADVRRAMQLLRAHGAEFNVLAVVNDRTARHAKRIYAHFRELGLTHMQFIPCVESAPGGAPEPFSVRPEAYGEFLCELFDQWLPEARQGVSERLFDALLCRAVTGASGLCTFDAGCGTYLVIEHNGDAYPCDFFVDEGWRLGNALASGFEELMERGRMRAFRAHRQRLPAACAECPWRDLCRGGCLKDRARLGRYDAPTYLCAAWKRFLPHAMPAITALAAELQPPRTLP